MSLEFGYKEGKKVARVRLILFLAPDTKRLASSLARERCVICLRPEELPKNRPFSFRLERVSVPKFVVSTNHRIC